MNYSKELTKEQYAAVTHKKGAAFVLAGPGSGKTRCITYRVSYLLDRGVNASNIIAITFTNKAAGEMKSRISSMLGRKKTKGLWVSTFHSMCARILRTNARKFGLPAKYTIADADDSKAYLAMAAARVFKKKKTHILKNVDQYGIGVLQSRISGFKYNLIEPESIVIEEIDSDYERDLCRVYRDYTELLKASHQVDFDDLLMKVALGLARNRRLREGYARQFKYILVDEYQDTNAAQYRLLRLLDSIHKQLFAVGDIDQAIYGFRGAQPENIRLLQDDYKNRLSVYTLEKNFRSYQAIADVANKVIPNNEGRMEKSIKTVRGSGDTVKCRLFQTPEDEAKYIAEEIQTLVRRGVADYKDFAILYRANSRSRPFEEIFRKENMPHRVIGSLGFYQRRVVKDLIAYMRLVYNEQDRAAFDRIVNEPSRGIGDISLEKIQDLCKTKSCSPVYLLKRGWYKGAIKGPALNGVRELKSLFKKARSIGQRPITPIFNLIVDETKYMQHLQLQYDRKSQGSSREAQRMLGHMELVNELQSAVMNYDSFEGGTLKNYLEFVSLIQGTEEDKGGNKILLMTVHAAKGLEFKHVYLVGCCEGILPHYLSMKNEEDVQEERRIFFVGATRAEDRLSLSHFKFMKIRGTFEPSRFLLEAGDTLEHEDYSDPDDDIEDMVDDEEDPFDIRILEVRDVKTK